MTITMIETIEKEATIDALGTFQVDEKSGVPIWIQIRKRLMFLISSGKFERGERLPSVRELSVRLGVNYNTINKVYQDLAKGMTDEDIHDMVSEQILLLSGDVRA